MNIFPFAAFAAWLAVLVLGCTVANAPPPVQSWEGPALRILALPRVVFADAGPDPFCERYLPEEIRWQVRRALERKGYRVIPAAMPARENSFRPDPWATVGAQEMLALLPEGAEAIVRVRIDRYLALDTCAKEPFHVLELDGTAELFLPGQATPIWMNRASARDSSLERNGTLFFGAGAELARNLFYTLPTTK